MTIRLCLCCFPGFTLLLSNTEKVLPTATNAGVAERTCFTVIVSPVLESMVTRLGSGAPVFSFLNHPITPKDRVTVRGGRFVVAATGKPLRFFGVNLAFSGNFPEPQDAARIAKRLRRLGVNLTSDPHFSSKSLFVG